jgi:hypothetical protein
MIESMARAVPRSWIVDAGRCTPKGNSALGTGPFGRVPSGAARQLRGAVGVVDSVIRYNPGRPSPPRPPPGPPSPPVTLPILLAASS